MKNIHNTVILTALLSLLPVFWLNLNYQEPVAQAYISTWGAQSRPGNTPTDIRQAIMNLTNWILGFVSMICVLMVLYGLATGAQTIKFALIGLVVTGLAYAMVIVVSEVILTL